MKNPYAAYRQQSVMTMTTIDILTTLYDELVKDLTFSIEAMRVNDLESANKFLQKGQTIVMHLNSSLDFKYEISNNLRAMYDFFYRTMVEANIKKDSAKLEELIPLITQLRDAYVQADKNTRSANAKAQAGGNSFD